MRDCRYHGFWYWHRTIGLRIAYVAAKHLGISLQLASQIDIAAVPTSMEDYLTPGGSPHRSTRSTRRSTPSRLSRAEDWSVRLLQPSDEKPGETQRCFWKKDVSVTLVLLGSPKEPLFWDTHSLSSPPKKQGRTPPNHSDLCGGFWSLLAWRP